MANVPAWAAGTARSQQLFWCCSPGPWLVGCQEAPHGLPGHPPELCKECPCARVAARQALPRHIPDVRAPGSTGDSRPCAREQGGSSAAGRAAPGWREPSSLRRSQHLGRDLEHHGSWAEQGTAGDGELGPWGGLSTPRLPFWQSEGVHSTRRWGKAGKLPSLEQLCCLQQPCPTAPAGPQPSHSCRNGPCFTASQKGPERLCRHSGASSLLLRPQRCCNPLLSRESGKLRQPRGFLGINPTSRQR